MRKQQNDGGHRKNSETLRALVYFTQTGFTMAVSVLIGVLLGKWLDGWLGTSPWMLLVFSFLGMGAAIKVIFDVPKQ